MSTDTVIDTQNTVIEETKLEIAEISFDKLNEITNKVKEERKLKLYERVSLARKDAIEHIVIGSFEKMIESAKKGNSSSDIYSFEWIKDKENLVDVNGTKVVFDGNILLLDLIKKDTEFFIELSNYFNKTNKNKFHCGYRKDIHDGISKWTIYVSWADKSSEIIEKKSMTALHVKPTKIYHRQNDNTSTDKVELIDETNHRYKGSNGSGTYKSKPYKQKL